MFLSLLASLRGLLTAWGGIKGDFESICDGSLDFKGSFSFNRAYPTAPNPTLNIDGLGHLGIPLNDQTAQMLISHCQQAPFGKGERTLVDTSVRDTWEIDASKVSV